MSTGNRVDLAAIEQFASSVPENATGIFFNPHAMAQPMLALVAHAQEADHHQSRWLRQYDAITLEISIILENADGLSKKQIVQRLDDLYAGQRDLS